MKSLRNKLISLNKTKLLFGILLVVLSAIVLISFIITSRLFDNYLYISDVAIVLRAVKFLAKNGLYKIENFLFWTDNFFVHLSILIVPLYLLTHNSLLCLGVLQATSGLLITISLGYFLKNLKFSINTILITLCIFISLNYGDLTPYGNVGIFYALTTSIYLIILGLYADLVLFKHSSFKKAKQLIIYMLSIILGFYGERFLMILFIPLLLTEIILLLNEMKNHKDKIISPLFIRKGFFVSLSMLCFFSIGYIGYKVLGKLTEQPFWLVPLGIKNFINSFNTLPNSLDSILGQLMVNVACEISFDNFSIIAEKLLRMTFLIVLAIVLFRVIKTKFTSTEHKNIIFFFVSSTSLVFVAFTIFQGYLIGFYVPRYFFFIWYFIIILIAIFFDYIEQKAYKIFFAFILIPLCTVSFYNNVLTRYVNWSNAINNNAISTTQKISDYLKFNDYQFVMGELSDIAKFEILDIDTMQFMYGSTNFSFDVSNPFTDYVGYDRRYLKDDTLDGKKIAIILNEQDLINFMTYAPDNDKAYLAAMREDTVIDGFHIYETYTNPVTTFEMPKRIGETSTYYFSKRYAYKNADHINYEERYIDVSQYLGASGPYIPVNPGTYDITLNYEYLDFSGVMSSLILYLGGLPFENYNIALPENQTQIVITGVTIPETKDLFEFVEVNGSKIRLYNITVTRTK